MSALKLGILTGGGDCPGLNAVIRAIVRKGIHEHGDSFLGFKDGWRGPLAEEGEYMELGMEETSGILHLGGTILGTSRTNPFKDNDPSRVGQRLKELGLDGLFALGGEDTLSAAERLHREFSVPVIGLPKTIDNDLSGTDLTFGFDSALTVAVEALDRLHSTTASHHRNLVVEIMGRHAGHLTLQAGLAGGADVILIPERPFDIEEVCTLVRARHQTAGFAIIAVAEGALPKEGTLAVVSQEKDAFGHARLGGIANVLEQEIEQRTGIETRSVVLGHTQRGGSPTASDRVLATRLGLKAVDAAHSGQWGTMPALRGNDIELVPLSVAVGSLRLVTNAEYDEISVLFT